MSKNCCSPADSNPCKREFRVRRVIIEQRRGVYWFPLVAPYLCPLRSAFHSAFSTITIFATVYSWIYTSSNLYFDNALVRALSSRRVSELSVVLVWSNWKTIQNYWFWQLLYSLYSVQNIRVYSKYHVYEYCKRKRIQYS